MPCFKPFGSKSSFKPAQPNNSFRHLGNSHLYQRMCRSMASQASHYKLQELYQVAKEHLSSGPPSQADAETIARALAAIPIGELGVEGGELMKQEAGGIRGALGRLMGRQQSAARASSSGRVAPMTYMHIHDEPAFSLGIFCLPKGNRIPLHNHPGMSVFSRVLIGSMHVRSFDWVEHSSNNHKTGGRAKLFTDRTVHERDPPAVLYPTSGGNIHEFTPVTDCAVLDLLSPPYNAREGRDCTYFREASKQQGSEVILEPYEPSAEFLIGNQPYKGQRIFPTP